MPSCAAVGCLNHRSKCKEKGITLFSLPKDENLKKLWIAKIKTKRVDPLPKEILLCEEHFSEDQFDKNIDRKNDLMVEKGTFCFLYVFFLSLKIHITGKRHITALA